MYLYPSIVSVSDLNLAKVKSVPYLVKFKSVLNLVKFKSVLNLVKFKSVLNLVKFKSVLNLVKFKSVLNCFTSESSPMREMISEMISATTLMDDGAVLSLS